MSLSCTIFEIFNVEFKDTPFSVLKIWDMSFEAIKTAPFDRPNTGSYQSATVKLYVVSFSR